MWYPIWSQSGSLATISCTFQHPQDAPLDLIIASCSRSSENQYSCILASHNLKASRVYIFSVTEKCPWKWPPQCLRSILGIQDPWYGSASASTSLGCQSPSCHFMWSQYHLHTQLAGSSSHVVSAKTQSSLFIRDRPNSWFTNAKRPNQTLESCFSCKVTSSTCKPSHFSPERRSLVLHVNLLIKNTIESFLMSNWWSGQWYIAANNKNSRRCNLHDWRVGTNIIQFIHLGVSFGNQSRL